MRTLFFILLSFYSMAQTETQSYEVLKNIDGCEIRFYPPVMMAKYTSDNGRSGFGKLFKYISGNNDGETKISMTTPVHMEKSESENSMAFVLPKRDLLKKRPDFRQIKKEPLPETHRRDDPIICAKTKFCKKGLSPTFGSL